MTSRSRIRIGVAASVLLGIGTPVVMASTASAETIRTSGKAKTVDISWIEYDPDDILGLPGNVHVGYLYASGGQYGNWISGSVTDFDCDEGETPWGGGHGVVVNVVDEGGETVAAAVGDAIEGIIDSGGTVIDAAIVATEVKVQLADDVTDEIQDEFEEFPACDFVQDRFLDGGETATISVDLRSQTAKITGTLLVHGGHGEHGEPGVELGRPPIDLTIVGGEWSKWTSAYSSRGKNYKYSSSEKGTNYYGGTVTGRIGGMGFADDADDEAFGGFGASTYKSVERVR